ncbi:MAG: 3-methyl-2-oxobutanoate hydroxymethyltransferase [Lentisphaerae bacterium]|nr:3-methyl-2-oxobutanoate hydroxymethyltransferase [Lentisphaerota bacterium]
MKTWTALKIKQTKGRQKLCCLTATDCAYARLLDEAGIPLILVGDSLAMTVLGYETTLPVTLTEMLHHTAAVARGTSAALVVGDMPFMSYQASTAQAVGNAGRFLKEAGADAVKLEGGAVRVPAVRALTANGIPVLGHIGLTPQSIRAMGGYTVQGRKPEDARRILDDARALDAAGVFAIVLECMPPALAAEVTAAVSVPTIGIGAGPSCDGQILVLHDVLGLTPEPAPKFVKRYADLAGTVREAIAAYRRDVENGAYPAPEHGY